jgi:DNA (cytosine-5)-methyltransferase 1
MIALAKRPRLTVADLFCGAGGTSTGALEAGAALGYDVDLTAINHNPEAIDTHIRNHPQCRTLLTSLDKVSPRDLYRAGELDMLWASPECTHHSVARGGKPINEQSRATAFCILKWADALRPPIILVENVPEFVTWGGCGTNNRPLLQQKGKTFMAWIATLESLGYRVDWRVLCAADYGDPTTRRRLIVQAVRGRRKIVWPDPTHMDPDLLAEHDGKDLFQARRKPWVPAREIIDWTLPSLSIYARKRALAPKTLDRIFEGLWRHGLKGFILPNHGEAPKQRPRTHSAERPTPAVTATGHLALVEPFIIPGQNGRKPGQKQRSHSINKPLPTVTAQGHAHIVEPCIVSWDHTGGKKSGKRGISSIDSPLPTVVTKARHGLMQPIIIELRGTSQRQLAQAGKSIDRPLGTVTAGGIHHALIESFLVQTSHGNGNGKCRATEAGRRVRSIKQPLPSVCGERGDWAVCEPRILPSLGGGKTRAVSRPLPTITTTARGVGLIEPVIVEFYSSGKQHASIHRPLDSVTTRDRFGLAEPIVFKVGKKLLWLDIRFRMLQPHELAAAQGFRKGYVFCGNKTQQVQQIGNAVPRNLAAACCRAAISQQS